MKNTYFIKYNRKFNSNRSLFHQEYMIYHVPILF